MTARPDNEERIVYDLLEWIARFAPDAASAQQAFDTAQAKRPEWRPSDHPDLLMWSGPAGWLPQQRIHPDELHAKLEKDPARAIEQLIILPEWGQSDPGEMSRDDALNSLSATVDTHPIDGVKAIDLLISPDAPADPTTRQRAAQAVLSAWTDAEIDDVLCDAITTRLDRIWTAGSKEWTLGSGISGSGLGWLDHAFNHWGGQIARIALQLVDFEYRKAGDGWAGLPESLTTVMARMVNGSDYGSAMAQAILAARVRYLFDVDEQWCRSNIMPLLSPDAGEDRAVRCWDAYLAAGATNQAMLEAGQLDYYLSMTSRLEQISEHSRQNFYQHLAAIALFSGVNPIEQGWLNRFTATANMKARIRWIQAITSDLTELSGDAADAQWNNWMRTYWENRLNSTPNAITDDEAATLTSWAFCLDSRFSEAVELACQHPAPADRAESNLGWTLGRIHYHSENTDHVEAHPEEAATLLTHILSDAKAFPPQGQSILRYRLDEMVSELLNKLDPKQSLPLREQAVRLGLRTSAG